MPTVPTLEAPSVQEEPLPGRPFPRFDENVPTAAFGGPVGAGLEDVGTAGAEIEAKHKIQNDNLRVIDANTQLEAGATAMLYGKPDPQTGQNVGGAFSMHGTDAINLPAKLIPQYQQMAQNISATLTPDQQRIFQQHVATGSQALNTQLNRYEYEESNRLSDEVFKNGLNQAVDGASQGWRDPQQIGKSRADIKSLMQLQGDREGWTPDIVQSNTKNALDTMHENVVQSMVASGNANTAQAYLNANIMEMNPKTSESMERLVYATQEHQLVMQEKQQKIASDNLSKQGDSLLANGKLTPAWIESHRNALEANEFRYFYRALSGSEESATNPQVYADLTLRAANGEDVRDDARAALVDQHNLSRQDFTRITGIVDQTRPGWFKRGAQYLDQALDPGQLNPDPAAHQSKADALEDWQEWAQRNPQATDVQARTEQEEIAGHYHIVSGDKTTLLMRAPMHLIGTRANPVDEQGKPDPMLNATSRRMMGALQSGEISQDQAQEEAKLIVQYRKVYQAQAANRAAKAAKGNNP